MANHASAIKRIRSNETKRLRNRYQLKSCRTAIKKFRNNNIASEVVVEINDINSLLDKLSKRNILHKNKSARMKSTLAKYVNGLKEKDTPAPPSTKKAKSTTTSPKSTKSSSKKTSK